MSSSQSQSQSQKTRRPNLSDLEVVALCNAYVKITSDAVTGTDQTNNTFWGRILEVYLTFPGVSDATAATLQKRFSTISKLVNKFVGYLASVPHMSGRTPVDWIELARRNYLEGEGKVFKLDHAFEVLRQLPKYDPEQTQRQSLEGIAEGSTSMKRPMGRKGEKERQRSNTSKRRVDIAQETINKTDKFMAEYRERQKQKEARRERIEKEMKDIAELQRRDYESRILFMDTSRFSETQLAIHQQEVQLILANRNERAEEASTVVSDSENEDDEEGDEEDDELSDHF